MRKVILPGLLWARDKKLGLRVNLMDCEPEEGLDFGPCHSSLRSERGACLAGWIARQRL
jgi:hypothetical protein